MCCVLPGDSHSDKCEAVSPCGFDCISLMISDAEYLHITVGHLPFLFGKMPIRSSAHFINRAVCFFVVVELYELFIYVGY